MDALSVTAQVFLSLTASAVPTALYVVLVWFCDRYEKEPLRLLAAAFLWGAIPAIVLAAIVEFRVESVLEAGLRGDLLGTGLAAPLAEEIAKGLALLLIVLLFRSEFDGLLDGIVYGALVGFGFAMTENLFYFFGVLTQEGVAAFGVTFALRGLLFGFNHAFFTAFTGGALGYAREARSRCGWWVPLAGLTAAVGFHAIHNVGAALSDLTVLPLLCSLGADAGGLATVVVILVLAMSRERKWLQQELRPEVGTLLTASELSVALSPAQRLGARLSLLTEAGWAASRREARFYHALTEYALLTARMRRGQTATDRTRAGLLRNEILALGAARRAQTR